MMDDLISRQAAIDAILAVTGNSSVRELYEHVQEHGLSEMWSGGVNAAIDIIIAVPSVQPEKRTEERTETHACDCIGRSMAVDAVKRIAHMATLPDGDVVIRKSAVEYVLLHLPSAQPEIIRCKDCKWKQGAECVRFADVRPFADDFCSRAERRTDG